MWSALFVMVHILTGAVGRANECECLRYESERRYQSDEAGRANLVRAEFPPTIVGCSPSSLPFILLFHF